MSILLKSPYHNNDSSRRISNIVSLLILLLFVFYCLHLRPSFADEDNPKSALKDDAVQDIVNPFDSDCYDWRGKNIPCYFKRSYAELLLNKSTPDPRFTDNKDGTVTDNLTKLVWLKNTNCFGMLDWHRAKEVVEILAEGACGPDPDLLLSDGSSAGDWRLPAMMELCTLIDYNRRDPALPLGHMFSDIPPGYHWSSTTIDYHPEMAWIVYFESGTTCYENVTNRAGYIWPVRRPKE
jgi:hypothetical protein